MSNTDSFINEVTEEVRRDRLFALMRRYGWIAVLAVIVIVGGAAWNEWSKAKARRTAEGFGDAMLAALNVDDRTARSQALAAIEAPGAPARAVLDLLTASEEVEANPSDAARRLLALADRSDVALVYRQIAVLKAVAIPGAGLSVEQRRARLDGLAGAGGLVRLLAEEQLALIALETGDRDAAIAGLQQVVVDAEATASLRSRASQAIVALGGALSGGADGTQ